MYPPVRYRGIDFIRPVSGGCGFSLRRRLRLNGTDDY
nr:MAG TPA: hypothetical protein [Bacteriophage sp.]